MMNDYRKENCISTIKKALIFIKDNRTYSRYEKIIIEDAKYIMTKFFEQYLKSKKEIYASDKAEYITSRIILATKENKVKTLQQTYREYAKENKKEFHVIKKENIDNIAYFCQEILKNTDEALKIIYKDLDKYYEE